MTPTVCSGLGGGAAGWCWFIGAAWWPEAWWVWLDWAVRLSLIVRVIMRRLPAQVSMAWLVVLLFAPVIGIFAYILVGEIRLGSRRIRRFEALTAGMDQQAIGLWLHRSEAWTGTDERYNQIARFATAVGGMPPLRGNSLRLLSDSEEVLECLIEDIDRSRSHCHLLTYIWQAGGGGAGGSGAMPERVADALIRAARRGVACRVLVDAVGSKAFLRSETPRRMRAAGVQVVAALPAGLLRMFFYRLDLRNHRKIAVIDGRVAYTGSQNITDSTFRSTRRINTGPWIDATVRVEGPAAQALAVVFLMDWQLDSGEDLSDLRPFLPDLGRPESDESIVQVVGSGPGPVPEAIHQALLTMVYGAREELIITTPYFVPDPATLAALRAAALRGVRVTLVVPAVVDAPLVAAASRSHFLDLLEAGVRILQFHGGLLHAKTVTADRRVGLIGSANIDARSFFLNFEVTMFLYDDEFVSMVRFMQTDFIARSTEVHVEDWRARPVWTRAAENTMQLLGPLL